MTERTYFDTDDLETTAEVVSCTPREGEKYSVVLSRTLFHPQGGGQLSDVGKIGDAKMLKATVDDGVVIHVTDAPVAGKVALAVDEETRRLNTRYHSAGHLISVAVERKGWHAMKGDHRPGEARVVFERDGELAVPAEGDLEAAVAELVTADLPRRQATEGGKRTVTWGSLPAYACGGTHVASTADVGTVRIVSSKERKGQLAVRYEL
jgi:Ser-tRNA(Ala) deacylase AlaX